MSKGNGGGALDPITVEVVRHKLDGIANEMESTLFRSAFSTIVKEALDASASIFTIQGETLAQAIAIPIHLTTLVPMVQTIVRVFPVEEMKEGDLYILNDPYMAGGTHIPDIAVIMPVFQNGRPIALTAALTHHQDVGGMTPGSTPTNATEIFQEGVRIPPLKLSEGGKLNDTLIKLLRLNVRLPDIFMGDLNAQIAACRIGARRLTELAETYGNNHLLAIFDDLLDKSEQLTRQALRAIPDGTYRYVDYLDNDGVELDKPVRIEVAVTIDGDRMVCDFTGSSEQVKGPFNCVPSGSFCAACFAVRVLAGTDIPTNGGCFRPIQLNLPEGSVVNPKEPAPVSCRTSTIKRVTSTVLGALRQAAPDRIPADSAAQLLNIHYGGHAPGYGSYVTSQIIVAGSGASMRKDGVDVLDTDATNVMNVPIEAIETDAPIRIHSFALAEDSGGAGEHRGGLGCYEEMEVIEGETILTYRGERHDFAAKGEAGGAEGGRSMATIRRADGKEEAIPSKRVTTMRKGDRLVFRSAGGGGYGDPKARPREAVMADIRNGKISRRAAREVYGLADPGGDD